MPISIKNNVGQLIIDHLKNSADLTLNTDQLRQLQMELYSKTNAVGSVSRSGSVPTGAIIERGSNANGEYVKFADGTMICWRLGSISLTSSVAMGSLHVSQEIFPATSWPAVFSATPTEMVKAYRHSGITEYSGYGIGLVFNENDDSSLYVSGSFKILGALAWSGITIRVRQSAIGRWF